MDEKGGGAGFEELMDWGREANLVPTEVSEHTWRGWDGRGSYVTCGCH